MTRTVGMEIMEVVESIGGVWLSVDRHDALADMFSASFPLLYSGIDFRRSKPVMSANELLLRSKPELGCQFLLATTAVLGGAAADHVWIFSSDVDGAADVELQRALAAFDDLWWSDLWIASYDAQWCLQFYHEGTGTAHGAVRETG